MPLIFQKLKPHIFTVGEQTYRNVKSLMEPINQSIVVSGESGAGKVCTQSLSLARRAGRQGPLPAASLAAESLADRLREPGSLSAVVSKHHTRGQEARLQGSPHC